MLDNLTDSLDNYVRDCYLYKYQIERHKITDCIVKNVSSIILLYNDEKIKDYTSKLALKLDESIHDDILGTNTYVTSQSDIQDMINIRVDIFKNSLIRYIREGPGGS